jgi:hypothetical protein
MTQQKAQQQDKQLSDIQKTLTGITTRLQALPAPGPSETVLPSREFSQPIDNPHTGPTTTAPLGTNERPSVTPSGFSHGNHNYKPKKKDPPHFDNNDGEIQYQAWKEQILDKFEEDAPQFSSARSYMSYLFNCTKGDAQKHLYQRYTRDKRNQNPFISYEDMLDLLDSICLNVFEERDSRNAYQEIKMTSRQSFQDFQTHFLHLANAGRIPEADQFDDVYDKMTIAPQDKLLIHIQLMNGDFNMLCTMATGADSELKRLNIRHNKEREARFAITSTKSATAPARREYTAAKPTAALRETSAGFSLLQGPQGFQLCVPAPAAAAAASPGQPLKCHNCGEVGHWATDCLKPKRFTTFHDIEEDQVAEFEPATIADDSEDQDQGNVNA